MIKVKRGSAWIWVIILLVLIIVGGIILYSVLSGNGGSLIPNGNSIPQPPV